MTPQTELETALQTHFKHEEDRINTQAAQGDLFRKPPTQKEVIFEFIKSRGRVLTHELNEYCCIVRINNPGGRARELKAEGKIWRIAPEKMIFIYGKKLNEEAWSIYECDR